MATYILVHGAWHGGWCYRDTAAALRAKGHTVFTPTLTGTGERFHQSHQGITLETHVRDVAGVVEAEELEDAILVGHSYGGMVITALADRMPQKFRSLVYLDAFVPENGESLMDLIDIALAPEASTQYRNAFYGTAREGNCGLMQPIPAQLFNVAQRNQAWVDRRCRPQALATFEVPVLLTGGIDGIRRRLYILADGWDPSPFRHFAARVADKPGWELTKLPCGHDVMVDMPGELAECLLGLA